MLIRTRTSREAREEMKFSARRQRESARLLMERIVDSHDCADSHAVERSDTHALTNKVTVMSARAAPIKS